MKQKAIILYKIVVVSGTIQSIGKDITDTAYLVIGGTGFLDGVQCMMPGGQESAVANVREGQFVTLKGKVSLYTPFLT